MAIPPPFDITTRFPHIVASLARLLLLLPVQRFLSIATTTPSSHQQRSKSRKKKSSDRTESILCGGCMYVSPNTHGRKSAIRGRTTSRSSPAGCGLISVSDSTPNAWRPRTGLVQRSHAHTRRRHIYPQLTDRCNKRGRVFRRKAKETQCQHTGVVLSDASESVNKTRNIRTGRITDDVDQSIWSLQKAWTIYNMVSNKEK